jgi:hypothetical protein
MTEDDFELLEALPRLRRDAARVPALLHALEQIAHMDPFHSRADDLGRAARIAREALGTAGMKHAATEDNWLLDAARRSGTLLAPKL